MSKKYTKPALLDTIVGDFDSEATAIKFKVSASTIREHRREPTLFLFLSYHRRVILKREFSVTKSLIFIISRIDYPRPHLDLRRVPLIFLEKNSTRKYLQNQQKKHNRFAQDSNPCCAGHTAVNHSAKCKVF